MPIALRLSRHLLLGVRDVVMVMHLELVVEKAATQELAAAAGASHSDLYLFVWRLFQQMLVDEYTMIEAQRLHYIRAKQHDLRCETYESLRGIQSTGNGDLSTVGQRVVLPSSFTGGALYMMQNYLDAMTLCRWYGYPGFFITITCNPNWPEVKRFLKDTTLKSEDRPDILCRLFKLKLDSMIKELKEKSLFGKVQAVVYTIEFQKRGLPHAHICMFMHAESKIHNPQLIDNFISAEIPNKNSEPELYKLVSDHMIHGPCGEANPKCTCMVNKRCSKNFPKRFQNETSIDSEGFPVYKRRDNGEYVVKSDINLENRSVVPYNKTLLKKFQAHINVEWCNQDGLIKYVSVCEATWRIFAFDVHYRLPLVMRLAFHLPGEHQVIYGADDDIEDVLNKTTNASSMFTDIRTVDGVVCDTFREACYRRGLLDDDKEYIEAIQEASYTSTGYYLRHLFATMLITYSLSRPHFVWESTWQLLVDGILYKQQKDHNNPELSLNEEQLKNLTLLEIENFFVPNNSTLRKYKEMPFPDKDSISRATNPLMVEELSYDTETMSNEFNHLFNSLTDEQQGVFNEIMNSLVAKRGGVFFVYGYGGTGKMYLWKTLSASIRSKGEVVLNVASSGIVSLLLEGGRTAHSRFLILINLIEDSQCPVKGNTDVYELLKKTSLIIWDKAPMIQKHAFEALDRTLKDVVAGDPANTSEALFGGKVVVFGGDFRQILPVVTNGTRSEFVNASINSSYIWSKCKLLKLTKNMRLIVGCGSSNLEEIKEFADWLLDICEGNVGGPNDGESIVEILDDLLILNSLDPIGDLIQFVYPNMLDRFNEVTYFQDRALLAPLNEVVQEINERMLALF
ncbi:uncharacterized protein LOC143598148 [Bidens hawaiensis]|uniref:uncharacterized protein LOC143598148 n=1 Tax=Bidens hawaiensis TaxID=980011 RepID=UPI00404A025F